MLWLGLCLRRVGDERLAVREDASAGALLFESLLLLQWAWVEWPLKNEVAATAYRGGEDQQVRKVLLWLLSAITGCKPAIFLSHAWTTYVIKVPGAIASMHTDSAVLQCKGKP